MLKQYYQFDFTLYKKLAPDDQPEMTLNSAIQDLVERLEFMCFSDRDFRNSRLMRLKVLSEHREQNRLDN